MRSKSYDSKYDIIKFILSLFVVLVHTEVYTKPYYPWIKIVVPMFFIILSYFLFTKLKTLKTEKDKNDAVKKFIIRNIKLYFFWFILLIPLTLINHRNMEFSNGVVTGFISNAIKKLFFGSTYMSSWFITASIFGIIIIYYLSKKLSNKKLLLLTLFSFIFVTLWACYLPFLNSSINKFYNAYYNILSNPLHSFPAALIWIVIGKCFAENTFKFTRIKSIILVIISFVLLYIEWYLLGINSTFINGESYFSLLPLCTCLFSLILTLKPFIWNKSIYLKGVSTVIYTLHGTLIPSIKYLWFNILNINSTMLVFLTDVIICIFIYILIKKYIDKNKDDKLSKFLKWSY